MSHKEFPLDVLPRKLELSIRKVAAAYSINVDPVAVAMLTILSAAIGNTTRVSPKKGWIEPVFIWSIIIGPSGSGKTPMVTRLLEYLYERQSEAYKVYQDQIEEYENKIMKVANRNANFRKPQLSGFMVSDITVEALALAMESQPRGILSYQDELSGWFLSHDQYRAKGDDKQKYLSLWSCQQWLKSRVSGSHFIPNTGCVLFGGIQPLILTRVFQQDSIDDGLLPRFLFTNLYKRPYSDLAVSDEDLLAWKSLIHDCYQIPLQKAGDKIHYSIIPFSTEAHIIFSKFHNELNEIKQSSLQVFIPKLISYAVRLSGILFILRDTKEKEISKDGINDTLRLIDYFLHQVKGTLALYRKGGNQYSEADERLINILKILKERVAHGLLSVDEITQEFNNGISNELCLDNQAIAYRLRALGLGTKRNKGYSVLVWDKSKIEKLFSTC